MWRSLVWKEWREQRWRLAFGIVLLGMFTAIGLRTRIVPDEQILALCTFIGGALLPLMVAMGLIAPERTSGTIARLLSLPVPAWHVLATKGLVGAATCAAPILASALLATLIAGDREMTWARLIGHYAATLGLSLSMFTWLTAAGLRQPTEARAALAGIAAIVGWILIMTLTSLTPFRVHVGATTVEWAGIFSPFGPMMTLITSAPRFAIIAIQCAVIVTVWTVAARRFAKPAKESA